MGHITTPSSEKGRGQKAALASLSAALRARLKRYSRSDWLSLAALVGICTIWALTVRAHLAPLDAPRTWDSYRDMAITRMFLEGHYWGDAAYLGAWRWYPPLFPLMMGSLVRVTGLPVPLVYARLPWLVNAVIPVAFYAFVRRFYGSLAGLVSSFALLFVTAWTATHGFVALPLIWSWALVPLLFLAWLRALRQPRFLWAFVPCGLLLGLALLNHHLSSLIAVLVVGVTGVLDVFWPAGGSEGSWAPGWPRRLARVSGGLALTGAIGLAVSVPGWFEIALYGGRVENPLPHRYVADQIFTARYLLFGGPIQAGLVVAGLVLSLRRRSPADRLLLVLAAICVTGLIPAFVRESGYQRGTAWWTQVPILIPHEFQMYLHVAGAAFIGVAAAWAWQRVRQWRSRHLRATIWLSVLSLLAAAAYGWLAITTHVREYLDVTADVQPPPEWTEARDWILANTDISDIFLAEWPVAYFHVNGGTGRKVVITHIYHASPYVNPGPREQDVVFMLGTDSEQEFLSVACRHPVRYVALDKRDSLSVARMRRMAAWPALTVAFENPRAIIYRIDLARCSGGQGADDGRGPEVEGPESTLLDGRVHVSPEV